MSFRLLSVALMLAAAALPARADEVERQHCFARFCVMLPAGFVRTADDHVVRGIMIEEKRWHNPVNRERAREFDSRTKAIEALVARRAHAASLAGTILQRTVIEAPRMDAILFHRNENPFTATWGALLPRGPVDLWLQADVDVLNPQEGLPRLAEAAQAYLVPELHAEAMRAGGLYHLRFGALALPYKSRESADVSFEWPARRMRFTVSMATLEEPRPKGLLDQAGKLLPAPGKDVKLLRSQVRVAGGMAGDEVITRPNAADAEMVRLQWTYAGDFRNEMRPKMVLSMEVPVTLQSESAALWGRILSSLQPAISSR